MVFRGPTGSWVRPRFFKKKRKFLLRFSLFLWPNKCTYSTVAMFHGLRSDRPHFSRLLKTLSVMENIDEIFPLSYVLHRMTWMIKHLHFYALPSVSLLNTQVFHFHRQFFLLPSSRDIHIKNSFVKCDRELMAFQLMNHRMEIELYVWRD